MCPLVLLAQFRLDFVAAVEVVGQCRMDIGQGDSGEHVNDFVRRIAAPFVPGNDVEDADAVTGDACLAATDASCFGDVLNQRFLHRSPRYLKDDSTEDS